MKFYYIRSKDARQYLKLKVSRLHATERGAVQHCADAHARSLTDLYFSILLVKPCYDKNILQTEPLIHGSLRSHLHFLERLRLIKNEQRYLKEAIAAQFIL
jgi:hypothetical protein